MRSMLRSSWSGSRKTVAEVVRFNTGLRQRIQRIIGGFGIHVVLQGGGVVFPAQPGLRGFDAGRLVVALSSRDQ